MECGSFSKNREPGGFCVRHLYARGLKISITECAIPPKGFSNTSFVAAGDLKQVLGYAYLHLQDILHEIYLSYGLFELGS